MPPPSGADAMEEDQDLPEDVLPIVVSGSHVTFPSFFGTMFGCHNNTLLFTADAVGGQDLARQEGGHATL